MSHTPLTHEYFQPLIEKPLLVKVGDQSLELRVTEVRLLPPPMRRSLTGKMTEVKAARAPFSVLFRSEGELGLTQGTYNLESPDGSDPLPIFLVPLGMEDGGVVYEAIFN